MNKEAISPLIATVLLIGFTVSIGVMIYAWYGGILKEQAQKQGALSQIQSSCATNIEISVQAATCSAGSCDITVKNEKNLINGLRVRINAAGTDTVTHKETFNSQEIKQIKVPYDSTKATGTVKDIEVMPMVVREGMPGTCSEKIVKYAL